MPGGDFFGFTGRSLGIGAGVAIDVPNFDNGLSISFQGNEMFRVSGGGIFFNGDPSPTTTDFIGVFTGSNPAAPVNGYRWFRTDLGEEFTFINGTTVPLWNMAGTIEPFAPPEVVTASVGYAGVMYDAIVGTQHIWTLMGAVASGNQMFVNAASGFTGSLLSWQVAGTEMGNVSSNGIFLLHQSVTQPSGAGIKVGGGGAVLTALEGGSSSPLSLAFNGTAVDFSSPTNGYVFTYNSVAGKGEWTATIIGATQSTTPFLTALGFEAAGITTVGGTPTTTGIDNTLIGYQAGSFLTTGTDVTAVGYQAAKANTANFTTAFGSGALVANTTGASNAAFGFQALTANTTGSYNAAFGFEALSSNTTGINNAAFGSQALYMNTGNYNAAFGFQALYTNTGNANAAFGFQALYANTTGVDNAAFGFQALTANTTGSYNAAFGFEALSSNTTGINNAAFGSQTLQANTTGGSNSAFGWQALYANTTGINNSAFGWQALAGNTGDSNSAFGYSALQGNASGINNSAFGFQALNQNTAGNANAAFGYQALFSNTNGFNSAFGNLALQFNTTGYQNSAFGYESLNSNTTGINNAAFGSALFSNTTGYQNSAFGIQAGYTSNGTHANTTGSNNIYFGYNAGPGIVTQLTYSGAIGSGAVVFDNNVVVIGSISGTNMAGATAGIATPGGILIGYFASSGIAAINTLQWANATSIANLAWKATSGAAMEWLDTGNTNAIAMALNTAAVTIAAGYTLSVAAVSNISDIRLKPDFRPYSGDYLSELRATQVGEYQTMGQHQYDSWRAGIAAQSLPRTVHEVAPDGFYSVRNIDFEAWSVGVQKAIMLEVDNLKETVARLEKDNAALRSKIDAPHP